jgi:RNA-directed DNA polymerase
MMHGPEKSDPAIVAGKPANKTASASAEQTAGGQAVAELMERRAGTKGNAGQQSTRRAQSRISVSRALERIRKVAKSDRFAVTHPRWEPYAGKPHVRFCAGGAG